MVELQGKLYTFGGLDTKSEIIDVLHRWDTELKIWERIDPINGVSPLPRMVFAMYSARNNVYVHGGLGTNGQLNDLWSYNVISDTWGVVK
jgi:N-acetylneuraminic acid mutarotase